jgi:hypothetical protein
MVTCFFLLDHVIPEFSTIQNQLIITFTCMDTLKKKNIKTLGLAINNSVITAMSIFKVIVNK